jgi:phosphoenolpyruvate-protein phosphotransferase (PTS system enzyme I)
MMNSQKYYGIGASSGSAAGKVWVLKNTFTGLQATAGDENKNVDEAAEAASLRRAVEATDKMLAGLEAQTRQEKGEEFAAIFTAHRLLLSDPGFIGEAEQRIQKLGYPSARALQEVTDEAVALFRDLPDPYLRQRADDVREVSRQVLQNLAGNNASPAADFPEQGKWIVVADELGTAETVSLPKERILGFIVRKGGQTSHAAILARTYGIPAVLGIDLNWEELSTWQGARLDGDGGWTQSLSTEELKHLPAEQERREENGAAEPLGEAGMLPGMTLAGNIGSPDDIPLLKKFSAEGVGLYRTEFLFMGKSLPTEDEQAAAYSKVIQACAPCRTVIRTLDIGGDKQAPALKLPQEKNPFLGVRAIRFCFQNRELFASQLRAIWRASVHGPVGVMFPMIATLEELVTAKEMLAKAKDDVTAQGYPVGEAQTGMMIEIPSAAWIAGRLAKEVDFFSIGTNDLTQYVMAVDRGNEALAPLYQPFHPAVLGLIRNVVGAAKMAGIWVGVCGESAGEPLLAKFFAALGIEELSMSPGSLPKIRRYLAGFTMSDDEKASLTQKILQCGTAAEVRAVLENA